MSSQTAPLLDRAQARDAHGWSCLRICCAHGWLPTAEQLDRLLRLREEVAAGQRSEASLSPSRLQFARWLVQHGYLNERA